MEETEEDIHEPSISYRSNWHIIIYANPEPRCPRKFSNWKSFHVLLYFFINWLDNILLLVLFKLQGFFVFPNYIILFELQRNGNKAFQVNFLFLKYCWSLFSGFAFFFSRFFFSFWLAASNPLQFLRFIFVQFLPFWILYDLYFLVMKEVKANDALGSLLTWFFPLFRNFCEKKTFFLIWWFSKQTSVSSHP